MGIFAQRPSPVKSIASVSELVSAIGALTAIRGLSPVVSPGLIAVTIDGRRVNVTVAEDDFPTAVRSWPAAWRKGADGERDRAVR